MPVYTVGSLYLPGRTQWPQSTQFLWCGELELLLFFERPTATPAAFARADRAQKQRRPGPRGREGPRRRWKSSERHGLIRAGIDYIPSSGATRGRAGDVH